MKKLIAIIVLTLSLASCDRPAFADSPTADQIMACKSFQDTGLVSTCLSQLVNYPTTWQDVIIWTGFFILIAFAIFMYWRNK